jgi:hypothetical protein
MIEKKRKAYLYNKYIKIKKSLFQPLLSLAG